MKQGWEYKKLNEVCEKGSSNIVISKLTDNDGDYPLYGASGLVKHIDFYHQDKPYIGIVKDGAGVGRVNIYPAYSSLVGTMQYIFPKKDCLLNFIKYFLVKLDLSHCVSGATIPHIYFKDYGKDLIPVPSLKIQEKIVSELDKINELIRLKKEQLKDYDNLAQSIFYEMFGDPVENEKGWEVKKLEEVCNITSSKRIFADEYTDKGIPFYRSKEVIERSKGLPISVELFISPERYSEIKEKFGIPVVGDILITAVGTIGKIWSIDTDEKFYFKDGNLVWLKDIDTSLINTIFFRRLLEYLIDEYKKTNANGAAYSALTIAKLKLMQCPLPPLPLQHLFAQRIEQIERQRSAVQKSITDLETLLASRMQYWFE